MLEASISGAWLLGLGALLAGVGGLLSGLAALKVARRDGMKEAERETDADAHP